MIPNTGKPHWGDTSAARGCVAGCPICERLRRALRHTLRHRGWPDLTEDLLATAAGVSRSVFTTHYPGIHACAVDALDEAAAELGATCSAASAASFPAARTCAERFVPVAQAALQWMANRPAMARMLFVVPEQTRDPVLLAKVDSCKHLIAALYRQPSRFSPAGSTHVEFMVGLFFHAARQHLSAATSLDVLRDRVLALASFTASTHQGPPRTATDE